MNKDTPQLGLLGTTSFLSNTEAAETETGRQMKETDRWSAHNMASST